jgi:glucosyl-3-phosphoglycerate synthase
MAAVTDARPGIATYDHRGAGVEELLGAKAGRRVAVCLPAHNEERTLGAIVETTSLELVAPGLVDELVVVDDGSTDATAQVAARAGARVVASAAPGTPVGPFGGGPRGKGAALARALEATTAELVIFLDADVENFGPHFVTGLLRPLLEDPRVVLVKGRYERPLDGAPTGGGRVTELVARPALSLLFPELAVLAQPLAGETALRRSGVEGFELSPGYGVEIGLLIDVARRHGLGAIAEVDLGVRVHRNRSLAELGPEARDVLAAVLARAGVPTVAGP